MTIQIDDVDNSISAVGTDTNIAIDLQPKGTGALNVAAGSSGVNISNGTTVTAVTRTSSGSGYTIIPNVTISAPQVAGGVQATATFLIFTNGVTINSGGTGYTVSDVLTVVGGTFQTVAAQITVTSVSGGVVTGATVSGVNYSVMPPVPASVTGGTGSGATFTVSGVIQGFATVTNAGSGYIEQPTVTFSGGGGGSGAAAYATIGSDTTLRALGTNLFLNTPSGTVLRLADNTLGANTGYVQISNAQGNGGATITTTGSNPNTAVFLGTGGTGAVNFFTNGSSNRQLQVSHTASAVNYVQVTGAATTAIPSIVAAGSDTNVNLSIRGQGTGYLNLMNNQANYFQVYSAVTGGAPTLYSWGSDTNVGLNLASKGTGSILLRTNGNVTQALVAHTASAVNYVQVTGAATGSAPVISAQGSDTNIPLVIQPKGTGALQAQLTDSTTTGGNARGANAVDWQLSRSVASRVASGFGSAILGGNDNTASGVNAVVAGGAFHTASGLSSYVGGGVGNTASGTYVFIGSGDSNTAAGYYNFIGGGYVNSGTSASAVTTQSGTMNGTTAVTLSGSNANIKVGQYITGTSIASRTYVAAISGTSLTLSQAASGSSTSTLSFFTPHGVVVGGGNNQATGSYSFIGGGGDAGTAANRNVASGDWSFVGGGIKNTASGIGAFIGGGGTFGGASGIQGNNATGTASSVLGGWSNTASGLSSSVTAGSNNQANSSYSNILSGQLGFTRGISSYIVMAPANPFSGSLGNIQAATLVLGKQTTDATPTVLISDSTTAGTTNQVILPNNSAYLFKATVISGVTGGGNTSAWKLEGAIKRGANAASTAIVGTVTTTLLAQDAGASGWVIAATADTTNGGLAITFTGQASTTIRTVCKVETTEMTY